MFSNFKRIISLVLLAGVTNVVFAAPAPVSDLSDSISRHSNTTSSGGETDVQRLERLLNNRSRVQLQMQQQIDVMAEEISELRGILERNSHNTKQMLERQRELFIELDKVRSRTLQVESSANAEAVPIVGKFTLDEGEEFAYRNAVDLVLNKKDIPGAMTAFAQFQKEYPNSSFIPNSHYWLGQLNFAQKEDVKAAESFALVLPYKDSNKRADSLLKLGDIAARNNKPNEAKKYYEKVISEHSGSTSANMAASRLEK